jgi:hypothetical protein
MDTRTRLTVEQSINLTSQHVWVDAEGFPARERRVACKCGATATRFRRGFKAGSESSTAPCALRGK